MDQSVSNLRKFLVEKFDDEALTALCFDYFREVYQDFTTGMRKSQKARLLVDYCQNRRRMGDLLATLERERPVQFDEELISTLRAETRSEQKEIEIVRNPRQIYIGHAHEDADLAHRLANDLRAHRMQVWIAPESIKPGEKWVEAINRGLDESGIFIVLLTKRSVKSRWVQSETNAAVEMEHNGELDFIPLQVEPTDLPPLWGNYQHISFQGGYKAGLNALLAQIESAGAPKAARSEHTKITGPETKPDFPKKTPEQLKESRLTIMRVLAAQEATKYTCAECGKSFDSPEDLDKHEANWHSATYQCPKCGLPFKTKENLDTHIFNWHAAYASELGIQLQPHEYKCVECGKSFDDQEDLEKHEANWHSSKHQCPQCGLPFKHPGDLDQHIRNWHP